MFSDKTFLLSSVKLVCHVYYTPVNVERMFDETELDENRVISMSVNLASFVTRTLLVGSKY